MKLETKRRLKEAKKRASEKSACVGGEGVSVTIKIKEKKMF